MEESQRMNANQFDIHAMKSLLLNMEAYDKI